MGLECLEGTEVQGVDECMSLPFLSPLDLPPE